MKHGKKNKLVEIRCPCCLGRGMVKRMAVKRVRWATAKAKKKFGGTGFYTITTIQRKK